MTDVEQTVPLSTYNNLRDAYEILRKDIERITHTVKNLEDIRTRDKNILLRKLHEALHQ